MRRRVSVVTIANEQVPITTACRLVGIDLSDDIAYGRSLKVHCPFGELYHSDGGVEPAFRVYPDSNSAYCFACKAYFSPVWLVAQHWGQPSREVAEELLAHIGYRPATAAQAWAQACARDTPPDRTLLAEALKTFCARIAPGWSVGQFDPDTAAVLGRCLALLDHVHTDGDTARWLDGCKHAMHRHLLQNKPSGYGAGELITTKGTPGWPS